MLGNKALLPLLWSMYPHHPYLLPAYYDAPTDDLSKKMKWVSKPIFGREGMGVFFSSNFTSYDAFVDTTEKNFGQDKDNKLGKSIY